MKQKERNLNKKRVDKYNKPDLIGQRSEIMFSFATTTLKLTIKQM